MSREKNLELTPSQERLIDRAVRIQDQSIFDREELGFSTRMFVQCSLPHRDPGNNVPVWARTNGNLTLSVQPGWEEKDGEMICTGYPYGNIPRLILFYICTQTVQCKSQEIPLGETLSDFMRGLDLEVTGGRWGSIGRFKDQFWRLFKANIDFTYKEGGLKIGKKANIANTVQLWWQENQPDQASFFKSKAILTKEFFDEIIAHPVPVDMGIVSAIKQSPLALDLYTWLTHRVTYLEKPTRISWLSLAEQVGSEYGHLRDFTKYAKESLIKIRTLWPELNIDEDVRGGIILKPSKPSVPKLVYFPSTK